MELPAMPGTLGTPNAAAACDGVAAELMDSGRGAPSVRCVCTCSGRPLLPCPGDASRTPDVEAVIASAGVRPDPFICPPAAIIAAAVAAEADASHDA